MKKFHFVEEYQALVKQLLETKPLDEAMSDAVGGRYELIGNLEKSILTYAGLQQGMKIVDYGCGSGRLATSLAKSIKVDYIGIDIIEELLNYAKSKSPEEYTFLKHQDLSVPLDSNSVDMVCAFSLFTHLLQAETYIYMSDMHRVLKPQGRLVFSFLEFEVPSHWATFEATVEQKKTSITPHLDVLNMFMQKSVIQLWAERIGFKVVELISTGSKYFDGQIFGQSLAILEK